MKANQIATEKLLNLSMRVSNLYYGGAYLYLFLISFIVAFLLKICRFASLFYSFPNLGLVISKVIYTKLNFHNESKKAKYHALFEEEVFKQITSIRYKK